MAHILMVEDNDQVAEVFGTALTDAGHNVDHSITPDSARIRVSRGEYDLIMMDIALINYDGTILAAELRAMGYTGPMIAVTGGMVKGDPAAAAIAEFASVLHKPINPSELIDTVNRLVAPAA